ncbi:MAG: TetR/AcrR family transcriptional regulator [Actinomycetota bacterium]
MRRMPSERRRRAIVDAALAVALRKGLGATTVRDVAAEMGTSSGLIHHYFDSMDEVLAAAFAQAAGEDLAVTESAMQAARDPVEKLVAFFRTYGSIDQEWAFQLWLDAWSEASRRPALRQTSLKLNLAWQQLLAAAISYGVAEGVMTCPDPAGAAWRIVSLLDGLSLQVVAHRANLDRPTAYRWVTETAEREVGVASGSLRI